MSRFYEIDGQKYASVTTILGAIVPSPELRRWREELGPEKADAIMRDAADIGRLVHTGCEIVNRTGEMQSSSGDPRVDTMVAAYLEWWSTYVAGTVECERVVCSPTYRYAGTYDLLAAMNDGTTALIDYKTTGGHYPQHALQLAAYQHAAVEADEWGADDWRRIIIRLDRDEPGRIEIREYTNPEDDRMWLYCVSLYHYFFPNGGGRK